MFFPVIIHAGSLFFALRHVFSDLLYIPNSCFELSACVSSFFAHTRFLFLNYPHVLPAFLHILDSSFWIIRMCFRLFRTYQILAFELSACVSSFFAHTRFQFLNYPHVFPAFLHILDSSFWIIRMCFQLFRTYLILVFELSACVSWFFAHTRFLFLTFAHVSSNALPK